MHQRQEQARLSLIINRIESYDVVDTSSEEASKVSDYQKKWEISSAQIILKQKEICSQCWIAQIWDKIDYGFLFVVDWRVQSS